MKLNTLDNIFKQSDRSGVIFTPFEAQSKIHQTLESWQHSGAALESVRLPHVPVTLSNPSTIYVYADHNLKQPSHLRPWTVNCLIKGRIIYVISAKSNEVISVFCVCVDLCVHAPSLHTNFDIISLSVSSPNVPTSLWAVFQGGVSAPGSAVERVVAVPSRLSPSDFSDVTQSAVSLAEHGASQMLVCKQTLALDLDTGWITYWKNISEHKFSTVAK